MPEKTINNANKMLLYRTILCFADEGEETTVTSIARKLNVEKYQISRIISTLEQQGIVEKNPKGVPSLTEQGKKYIEKYQSRVNMLVSFLLRVKLDPVYARDLALHIAGNANDEIMSIIEDFETRLVSKEKMSEKLRFSGNQFARNMMTGSYTLSCTLISQTEQGLMNFVNQDKPQKLILNISGKRGTLQFFPENDKIRSIKYFDNGEYIQAERVGDIYYIPAESLNFTQMGKTAFSETGFLGIVNVKISLNEDGKIVERPGVIEIIF